jgi:hypothetical protein
VIALAPGEDWGRLPVVPLQALRTRAIKSDDKKENLLIMDVYSAIDTKMISDRP